MGKLTWATSAVTQELTLAVVTNQELAEVLAPTPAPMLVEAPTQELTLAPTRAPMLVAAPTQELAEVLGPADEKPMLAIQTQYAYPE